MGYATNHIYKNSVFYEEEMFDYIANISPNHNTILDIGANIGNHTIFFAEFLNAKTIYSFEPNPSAFQLLEKNTKQYNHVSRYKVALGETESIVAMEVPGGYLEQSKISAGGSLSDIKMVRLDSFDFTDVTLMKIDVEEYEIQVLIGGLQMIERCKPGHIFIEAHNVDYLFAIIKFLVPFGYVIANVFERVTYHFERLK